MDRLARHHNVVISESAILAAVDITDRYQTDRMRPDRAIDALDEACAHTHAVATYSERAQDLIRRRRQLASKRPDRKSAESSQPRPEPVSERPLDHDEFEDDPIERMARDGFAALERFGAEIEAIFVPPNGTREPATATANGAATAPVADSPVTAPKAPVPDSMTMSAVDEELQRVLTEEGIVVRGHDVARVVRLATGKEVTWTE